jgi:hypothetical protein
MQQRQFSLDLSNLKDSFYVVFPTGFDHKETFHHHSSFLGLERQRGLNQINPLLNC